LRRRRVEGRLFRPSVAEAPEPPGPALSPLAQLVSAEERDQVRDSVSRLPEHYRLPVLLRYYSELSYDQIAAALGLSRNNVATLLFRAKKDLRRQLAAARQEVKAQ
jgi:RNA polymerase sigma-70 factor (ECF subfamily)